jgi:hypothetical protein
MDMMLASRHALHYITFVARGLRFYVLMLLQLWKKGRCVFTDTRFCSFSGIASAPCDGQVSTGAVSGGL